MFSSSNYNMSLKPVDMVESDLLEQLKEVGFSDKSGYYPTYALADRCTRGDSCWNLARELGAKNGTIITIPQK
jgi:hypothetical protein